MARQRWTREESEANRKAKLEWLEERITERVEQLVTGNDWLDAIKFAAKFRTRSFRNTLAIYAQHQIAFAEGRVPEPWPSLIAGYSQWQALGRWPTQPGYLIRQPVHERTASMNPASGVWRKLGPKENPLPGETVRSRMVNVKQGYVWDVSQTDGEDVPQRPKMLLPEGAVPDGLWEGIVNQATKAGFVYREPQHELELGGALGLTNYTDHDWMISPSLTAPASRAAVGAHELGHMHLHDPDAEGREPHRGIREVEAESFAAMLCAAYDLDTLDSTVPYVAGWAGRVEDMTPGEVIRKTGERVRQAVLSVIAELPEPAGGDGEPPKPEQPEPPRRRTRRSSPSRSVEREPEAVSL